MTIISYRKDHLTGIIALAMVLFTCMTATAQTQTDWQQSWHEMMTEDEEDDGSQSDVYEQLSQLAAHPIDLNHTTRQELQQLPFLSDQQIMDLVEYLDRYGPMRSWGELRMIRSMDYRQLRLMPFFTRLGEVDQQASHFPSWRAITHHGKHTLTATGRLPFYERQGDSKGYLGYPYRHALRYEFAYGQYVKASLIGAQDAGEPFFSDHNTLGYDTYSYYIQVRQCGLLENAVVGKYKVSTGMGLVMGSSFSLGKLTSLQSLGRTQRTLRPHSSRAEADYFRGAAATVQLNRALQLTLLASHRQLDATLNTDGTAATLVTNGYHRTVSEMNKKHNMQQTALGGTLQFSHQGFQLGISAVSTHLDRPLKPDIATTYRRYFPQGSHFLNAGVDYGFTHHRWSLHGETAINQDRALATIHALSYQPAGSWALLLVQRYYSYRYSGLHTHAFGEGSRTQNESGIYLGVRCQPLRHLQLQAYADYAYFPWPRYQVGRASSAWDLLLQADYGRGPWLLQGRHRSRLRQKDNENKTALVPDREHRERLSLTYQARSGWHSKSEAHLVINHYKVSSSGWLLSQQWGYQQPRWRVNASAAYFDTDDYDSRIYVYEQQMQHDFSFPMFQGNGIRLALIGQCRINEHLLMAAKLGHTQYFDRSAIGSGLQRISHSHMTDLDAQLRWNF